MTCGKMGFETYAAAHKLLQWYHRKNDGSNVYRCAECNKWHLGRGGHKTKTKPYKRNGR